MTIEEIEQFVRRQPFKPFILHTAAGFQIRVTQPDKISISSIGRLFVATGEDGKPRLLDCSLITGITEAETFKVNYRFQTAGGSICEITKTGGGFEVRFGGELLGSYASAEQAARDLARGATFTPSSGVDIAALGIPDDLSKWERL